jgi:PKD repeat protein
MNKNLLLILAFSLSLFSVYSQDRTCGTMENLEYLKSTRPGYEQSLIQYNQMISDYIANMPNKPSNTPNATITIPVVVHVVYRTAAENISDAQVISQIQVLNEDFARTNADRIKVTQPTFSTSAGTSVIQFCLAQRDPNGNPTNGITRRQTTTTSFSTNNAVKNTANGGQTSWNVSKYLNIWVCNLGSSLLGYGEFPTGNLSNTWGIVLNYRYTGRGGASQSPFNLGRTGTHEIGHCLNLSHIWGDENGCSGSDQCADTPNQAASTSGCPTAGSVVTDACATSSPGKMWMNYMDYTNDACMYMFSKNQVTRMEAIINNPPWNVLKTSNGCQPVSTIDASVASILNPTNSSSTCNNNVTPKIVLTNIGTTTMTSSTVFYKMDATATQTLNWTGSLTTNNSATLTLNAYNGLTTSAHTFSVWINTVNGTTDQNATNNSQASTFTVTAPPTASALPFTERFENVTFPPTGWVKTTANNLNAANTWTRVANATGIPVSPASTACARMDNYSGNTDITGQKDQLRTPALDFSNANSSLKLKFDVSHRRYSTTRNDSLKVLISTDCGATWTRIYHRGGSTLANAATTQTTSFVPTNNNQWLRDSVSLSSYAGLSSVYLRFESVSNYGNNVYLDNINVDFTPVTTAPTADFSIDNSTTNCPNSEIQLNDESTDIPGSWTWTSNPSNGVFFNTSTSQNPTVTFPSAGVYSITLNVSNSSGSTSKTSTININPAPAISISPSQVCFGILSTITASGADTYTWSTGATTSSFSVAITNSTIYNVEGTNSLGCKNDASITITVNPLPNVSLNATDLTLCINESAQVLTGSPTGGIYTGNGVTGSSFDPAISGLGNHLATYSYTNTSSGCVKTATLNFVVSACTGVEELLSEGINIYPNPIQNSLTIDVRNDNLLGTDFEIFDGLGKSVLKTKITQSTSTFNLSDFASGIYTVRLINQQSSYVKCLIKE